MIELFLLASLIVGQEVTLYDHYEGNPLTLCWQVANAGEEASSSCDHKCINIPNQDEQPSCSFTWVPDEAGVWSVTLIAIYPHEGQSVSGYSMIFNVVPEPMLFGDGFETGDTNEWSSVNE